jgi:hypothetical protein
LIGQLADEQYSVSAQSLYLCHFMHHCTGQPAFALFHGKINLSNICAYMKNTFQFTKL